MASVPGDIAIIIGADIAPLVTNLGRGQAAISKFGKTVETTAGGGMAKFAIMAGTMAGAIVAGLPALARFTNATLDQAGALHDASAATGVQVSSLQAMSQVATEASVSSETLVKSLQRMQNNIAGLASGTKAQVVAFGALGLSLGDLAGKGAEEQFAIIAEKIEAIADPTAKTAAAMDIFGKTGADLIPVFENYATTLDEVARAQRESGVSQTQEQNAALDAMGDNLGRIGMAAQGLGAQLLVTFGPMTLEAVEFITNGVIGLRAAFEDFKDAVTTTAVEDTANKTAEAIEKAATNAENAADMARVMAEQLQDVADPTVITAITSQAEHMDTLAASLRASGISAEGFHAGMTGALQSVADLAASAANADQLSLINSISQLNEFTSASKMTAASAELAAAQANTMAAELDGVADPSVTAAIRENAALVASLAGEMRKGGGDAQLLEIQIKNAIMASIELATKAQAVDGLSLANAIAEMGRYGAAIAGALGFARSLATLNVQSRPDGGGSNAPAINAPALRGPAGMGAPLTPDEIANNSFGFGIASGGGGGGGGGGSDKLAEDLAALQESLQSQAALEQTAFEKSQQILVDALAAKKLTQEQFNADMELLQADHQERMSQIDAGSYGDSAQKMGAYFGVLADTFSAGNERMAKAGRVFGAAEALVNAWRGYVQTLAEPGLPFFAKFAAAGSVLAAGMKAAQAISGGGRGGGGSAPSSAGGGAAPSQGPLLVSFASMDMEGLISVGMVKTLFDKLSDHAGDRGWTFAGAR